MRRHPIPVLAPACLATALLASAAAGTASAADRDPSWDLRVLLSSAPGIDKLDDADGVKADGGSSLAFGVVYTHPLNELVGLSLGAGLFSNRHSAKVEGFSGTFDNVSAGLELSAGAAWFATKAWTIETRLLTQFGANSGSDVRVGNTLFTNDGGSYTAVGFGVAGLYTFQQGFQLGGELRYLSAKGENELKEPGQPAENSDAKSSGLGLGLVLGYRF